MSRFFEIKEIGIGNRHIIRIDNIQHIKEDSWYSNGEKYQKFLLIFNNTNDNFCIDEENYKKLAKFILSRNTKHQDK